MNTSSKRNDPFSIPPPKKRSVKQQEAIDLQKRTFFISKTNRDELYLAQMEVIGKFMNDSALAYKRRNY